MSARTRVVPGAAWNGRPRGAASPPATGFPGAYQRSQQWRRARCDTGRSAVTPPADGGDACSNLCSNGTTLLPASVHRPAESRIFARFSDKRRRHPVSRRSSSPYRPTDRRRGGTKTRPRGRRVAGLRPERLSDPSTIYRPDTLAPTATPARCTSGTPPDPGSQSASRRAASARVGVCGD